MCDLKIAKDPFYLYETLISQEDWTKYMGALERNRSPIREFPRVDQVYKSCHKIMASVGARDIVLQSYVYDNKGDYEKLGLGPKDRPDRKEMENLKEKFSRIVLPEVDNVKKETRARALERLRKRREGLESLNWAYSWYRGSSSLINELAVLKIDNAVGKRLDEANQKSVMGNVSATEIGRAMGWSSDRLSSGVYPAEWLHLSAFSWGGVANAAEKDGFITSQNFENLVFGTSETNSVMTRYEMAWQRLFRAESELAGNEQDITGTLSINCNDFSRKILFDVKDGEHYKTGVLEFTEKELKLLEDGGFKSGDYYQKISGQKRSGSATKEEMLILANDFPFIVYSIDYGLTANFVSRLFQVEGMECWFSFYPFRRQFYHRAEEMLDDKIFKKLKQEASGLKEKKQPFSIIKANA
ncbi:hypothetical protein Focb16_v013077 [Fusarium oxysporum f. sp. cubense]|uniref:Uncharacterized protein n=1 Tax=Fusarium oxysporum f. sp. cubense TaxID=61366 RepID=A0A559KR29_FUSOC|nr:hypothetical protein Focb16_v013077 [Fusarium oxysporum f. sp. cubense]